MKKVALVSGASGGIGAACCKRLAANGFCVAALYHKNAAAAEAVVREITAAGGKAAAFGCDIRDSGAVARTVNAVRETFGAIDVLVGCAGVSRQRLFQEITDAQWNEMRGVHLDGSFYLTRAVLPEMVRKKQGRILHIASMWGETGGSCEADYSAMKAGLIGLCKALAKEVAPSGIWAKRRARFFPKKSRSGGSARPRTWRARSRFWQATTRPISPGRCCPSTAAL